MCDHAPPDRRKAWRLLVLGGEVVPGTLGETRGRPKSHQAVVDEVLKGGFGFSFVAARSPKPNLQCASGVRT